MIDARHRRRLVETAELDVRGNTGSHVEDVGCDIRSVWLWEQWVIHDGCVEERPDDALGQIAVFLTRQTTLDTSAVSVDTYVQGTQ